MAVSLIKYDGVGRHKQTKKNTYRFCSGKHLTTVFKLFFIFFRSESQKPVFIHQNWDEQNTPIFRK